MKTPPDTVELGNAGWTLLHTVAAYYPQKASEDRQKQTLNFLQSLSNVYPCNYCAKDFQEDLKGTLMSCFVDKQKIRHSLNHKKNLQSGCVKHTIVSILSLESPPSIVLL
jgi:hypothetical protein